MSRKILALAGETEVGKDTFAEPLIQNRWAQLSFARNLKQMCIEIFQLTPALVNTQAGKKRRFTVKRDFTQQKFTQIVRWMARTHDLAGFQNVIGDIRREHIVQPVKRTGKPKTFRDARELLQFIGTDVCRRIFPEYHLDVLRMEVEKTSGNVVITDARFTNEREMLKKVFGATLIRIKRPLYTPVSPPPTQGLTHESERSLGTDEEYDVVFINNGKIKELHEEAKRYLT